MYCITHKDQFAERLTKGFTGKNYSQDGNWVIGDKGDQDMHMWCDYRPEDYPQWLTAIMTAHNVTSCCLSHEVAKEIVRTQETSEGAADRWCEIPEDI